MRELERMCLSLLLLMVLAGLPAIYLGPKGPLTSAVAVFVMVWCVWIILVTFASILFVCWLWPEEDNLYHCEAVVDVDDMSVELLDSICEQGEGDMTSSRRAGTETITSMYYARNADDAMARMRKDIEACGVKVLALTVTPR